ncbi:hypothetical protein SAMN05421809_3708 [Natronorubrum daqingense]|uniref:Uncharacterized protein n=1 Tax=Natronorubrum daqingense TaxID=588898 RepID=A0A1N7G4A4_9EURY|nr:hypothetical protein SAMN05421809_3708 [Natronorubrum daqingense]
MEYNIWGNIRIKNIGIYTMLRLVGVCSDCAIRWCVDQLNFYFINIVEGRIAFFTTFSFNRYRGTTAEFFTGEIITIQCCIDAEFIVTNFIILRFTR